MNKIKKIHNVEDFVIYAGNSLFITNNKSILAYNIDFKQIFQIETIEKLQEIYTNSTYLWVNTITGIGYLITKDFTASSKDFFIKYIDNENNILCSINKITFKKDINGQSLWGIEDRLFMYLVTNKNIFYKKNKNLLIAINNLTGEILWQFHLSNQYNFYRKSNFENSPDEYYEAEIIRIIGEYNDAVWVVLNNGRLLGLETQTGKVKHDLLKPLNFITEEKRYFEASRKSAIDKEKGILFGINQTHYFEIDLQKPEESYLYYDISETCILNQIEADYPSYELVWHQNEIFIGQNQQHYDKRPCHVGIFDRETRQIIWTSRQLDEEVVFKGIRKIDYAENRLYVLDMENNLYVFER
jgi:outer membrane protein assembly factor BamB